MENKINVAFAAIDKIVQDNIIENNQKEIKGREFIEYGDKNIYPNYIDNLYESVSVLKSLIIGISDYVCGKEIKINRTEYSDSVNPEGETIEDIVKAATISYLEYGGFALNILRNRMGGIAAIYNLDWKCIRSDKKNTKFYYSEQWGDRSLGRVKTTTYDAFNPDDPHQLTSILYVKNDKKNTYPTPSWGGAVISAECLKRIGQFHLNSLYNGLSSDYIVNFNAGQPAPSIQEEIEENWNERFNSFENGARTILSWNSDFAHRTTIEAIPQSNFIDKYNALYTTSVKDLFTAFRCHPALFGLPTDNSGFNSQDLMEAFKLANVSVILPIQKLMKRTFEKIYGEKDIITIEPMEIDWSEDEKTEDVK